MTTAMGPPPPRSANTPATTTAVAAQPDSKSPDNEPPTKTPMGSPPSPPPLSSKQENPSLLNDEEKPDSSSSSSSSSAETGDFRTESAEQQQPQEQRVKKRETVPYTIPEWSGPPCHNFYLEVLKEGTIVDQLQVHEKGAYMFGRVDLCDFVLEHPTISRFHAVLQFKRSGDAYLYDLGSTHGTLVNKKQVEKRVYVDLHVGDVIRFGLSTRLYIFQGPAELMPPELDRRVLRDAKIRQLMLDREASIRRAREEASLSDGISWGMGDDAVEEAEDDDEEVTWQTFKGQLTDKQEKTRDKIVKRLEKIAHMKKEIDAIRAKDIAQGGLTQGQQTQIARNEQRISQIMEELENLEETLNDSIRESIGARTGGLSHGKKKGMAEDEEEFLSDDDEFYDRTKKPAEPKSRENQSIETADSLLDKRDAILKEMEEKKELVLVEKNKMGSDTALETDAGDALDAFMSGLSSQLVLDKTAQLEKELSALQSELDRIFFLLKIADPSGDAAKKRDSKILEQKTNMPEAPSAVTKKQPPIETMKSSGSGKPTDISNGEEKAADTKVVAIESNKQPRADKIVSDAPEVKPAIYTIAKPQWLGDVDDRVIDDKQMKEIRRPEILNADESDHFVDYKDRQKVLLKGDKSLADSAIETAAAGLIVRKRKENEPELMAQDAVALLLKHKRGYHPEDDEIREEDQDRWGGSQGGKDSKRTKKVVGPEKPAFLNSNSDYDSWVPPEGQSGDGRTHLNDRYGY